MGHDTNVYAKGQLKAGIGRDELLGVLGEAFAGNGLTLDQGTGAFEADHSGDMSGFLEEHLKQLAERLRPLLAGPGAFVVRDFDSAEYMPFWIVGFGRNDEEAARGELYARIELAAMILSPRWLATPPLKRDEVLTALLEVAQGERARVRLIPATGDHLPVFVSVASDLSDAAAAVAADEARIAANRATGNGTSAAFWPEFKEQAAKRGLVLFGPVEGIDPLPCAPWDRDDPEAEMPAQTPSPPAPVEDAAADDDDGPPRESVGRYSLHPWLADELSEETREVMGNAGAREHVPPESPCGKDVSAVIGAYNELADRLRATLPDDHVLHALAADCAKTIEVYIFG